MSTIAPDQRTEVAPDVTVRSHPAGARRASQPSPDVTISTTDGPSTAIALDDSQRATRVTGSSTVFQDARRRQATWVKGTPGGAQVVFAVSDAGQLDDLSVTFVAGIAAATTIEDTLLLTLGDGQELAIEAPWARDARGRSLPTSYQVVDSTVVQHVRVDERTRYPVLADPAWSYAKTYDIGNTSRSEAKAKLHNCFNCYFPVAGAPSRFPKPRANLPLNVANLNFHCSFDKEWSGNDQGGTYWGYRFNAKADHVDGAGSHINFTFRSGRTRNTLTVYAYIKNTRPAGLPQLVYKTAAQRTWKKFAKKMTA